jgi:hypothetical protein
MSSTPATVDASPSEPNRPGAGADLPGWMQALLALKPVERLAGLGMLICAAATLLPWYRAPVEDLGKTPWGGFGFALLALLVTLAAVLGLLIRIGGGYRLPMPLREGTLLALAGVWAGGIIIYLMFDRPQFRLAGFDQEYRLAYGAFVALGGAALTTIAGLRIRRTQKVRERREAGLTDRS